MGRIKSVKAILFLLGFIPFLVSGQNYPRFELYQLKQGTDSGQFIVTGLDSNLAFNNILRFRSADSTFLIGMDTVITDQSIIPILLRTIDAGLGIDVNQVNGQIFIESLSIEDSIYNGTVSTISKGTPLYATGVQGNYWSVEPADASDPNKMPVVVIAGEDIASGAVGLGLIKGHIKQVNTTGLADGAEVYVASGGGYTSTKPTAEGVVIQRLGTVIKGNSSNGSGIINLGDEAYWNDYVDRTELGDTVTQLRTDLVLDDLTENYMWIGNASNQTSEILSTNERTGNTIVKRDASGKFKSNFIEVNNGWGNVGIGFEVFNSINNGNYFNTAVGHNAGTSLTSGDRNTFYGWRSGYNVTTGGYNTFIGTLSGYGYTTTGANNTLIGYDAQPNSGTDSNSISIGYQSRGNGSNTIVLGNSNNTSLQANNYKFNIDQDLTGKNGFQLTYNSATMEIELDSAGGGGGAVGGIDSVIADQVTILGNGVDQTLRVDTTNTIATRKFVLDNSGGGGSQWVTSGSDIYYNTGNVGINNSVPSFKLDVGGDIYSNDDIFVDDELIFGNVADGSVPYIDNIANYMYLSVNASSGTLFNFRDRYYSTNPFIINANNASTILDFNGTSDFAGAMNIEGNLTQSGSIVHDGGSVTFNNTQSGSYDFGVGSLNHLPFMWVDASADKMAVGGGTPAYTLDVTGDINFTGDLYDNGSLVSFSGTTINNNADNRIITGSSTANTLNGESGLTWDGTTLNADGIVRIAYNSASGGGYYLRNTSTGLTSNNGIAMSLDLTDFYLTNYENAGIILTTNNNANQRLILKNDGTVQFTAYGSGTLSTDASGNISASDGRFKTVTRTMEYGLDKVMKLKPLYYKWNENSGFNTEFEEAGFIAQDVKKVIPEAVPNEEEENRKLNYSDRAIIATLTKAIQEQQEMIEELQKEIKRIKRKIK